MLHKLEPAEYHMALPLLATVEHALIAQSVAEGTIPGWVAVDSPDQPRTALVSAPAAEYVIGDCSNSQFNQALASMIREEIIPQGREKGWAVFNLHYWPDGWEQLLDDVFADTVVVKNYQRYYQFANRRIEWQGTVPRGFTLGPIDGALLEQQDLENMARIRDSAEGDFGSAEAFLQRGFGFCLLHGDVVASWCTSDAVSGNRCEIGIHTDRRYRRRGLATITVAATVDHCLSHGLTEIGWHCWSQNLPSAAVAEKVGFEEVTHHHAIHIWLNPIDGLLVNGNLALMRHQFGKATAFYERAFAEKEALAAEAQSPYLLQRLGAEMAYRFKAACAQALAGDRDSALQELEKALEKGTDRWAGY
jgi:GNAT superfamily N-acetyltransferase